jgi:hypothetical protein
MNTTAILEWRGKEYELKYSFNIIRRIRAEGVNIPALYRNIRQNPEGTVDYMDDIAFVVAWLLREAGVDPVIDAETGERRPLKDEDVFRECLGDLERFKVVLQLFMWVCNQHFATSENAPRPKVQPVQAGKRKRT